MRQSLPTLYSFRRCPYAMRARMAILSAKKPVILREIVLRNKPAEMLAISPKATVPVLLLPDGSVIEESLQIMQWALEPKNDPHKNALIEQNDQSFKHHLDRYKYPNRYEGEGSTEFHREKAIEILQTLNERLAKSNFLEGPDPSFTDLAVFPFVRQFAAVDRDWFTKNVPIYVDTWLQSWLENPAFLHIMKKLPTWSPGDDPLVFPFEENQHEI